MSMKSRVDRLETASGKNFVVGWPSYLDGNGNPLPWDTEQDAIGGIRFSTGEREVAVIRMEREPYEGFSARAHAAAKERLGIRIWLPAYIPYL